MLGLGLLPDLTPRDSHTIWYTSSRNPLKNPIFDPTGSNADPSTSSTSARHHHHHQLHNDHGHSSSSGPNGFNNNNNNNGHNHNSHHNGHQHHSRRHGGPHSIQSLVERTQLARLRAEEQQVDKRLTNVQNFGASWLKPPGVPKTLHHMREEQREAAEHAEAMRREQLQADLAEAEAAGMDGMEGLEGGDMGEGGGQGAEGGEVDIDDIGDRPRDLDEDIPDADTMGMSGLEEDDLDDAVSSSLPSTSTSADSDSNEGVSGGRSMPHEEEEEEEEESSAGMREERRNELLHARMRMANDSFRLALARGDADGADMYGAEEELEAEDDGQMLLEEDARRGYRHAQRQHQQQLRHHPRLYQPGLEQQQQQQQFLDEQEDLGLDSGEVGEEDLDMDADLDGSVPEAAEMSGVYEHTDSEAELSSSSDEEFGGGGRRGDGDGGLLDDSFAPRSSIGGVVGGGELRVPTSPTLAARGGGVGGRASHGLGHGHGHNRTRRSVDLSSLLSGGDGSPQARR